MRGHRDDLHVEATKVPGNGHAPKRMDAAQNDRDVAVEGERAIDFPARMSSGLDRVGLGRCCGGLEVDGTMSWRLEWGYHRTSH